MTGYLAIAGRLAVKPVSALGVVHEIGELLDTEVRFRILQEPRRTIDRLYLDIRKAKNRLGWEPESTLADRLKRTIEWHREAYRQENAKYPRASA